MKKSLVALAALAVVGAASAQSSVTMYGVADVSLAQTTGRSIAVSTNGLLNNGNSRLGVKGTEDLGGGLKASFNMEEAINLGNGATDANTYQRNAYMALSGNFGEVYAGRRLSPEFYAVATYELTGAANYSAVAGTFGFTGASRNDSFIAYTTPNMGGFSATLGTKLPGNDTAPVAGVNNGSTQLNVIYNKGPLAAALGYEKTDNAAENNVSLGGSYDFGMAKVAVGFYDPAGVKRGFSLGATVPVGAAASVTLDAARDTGSAVQVTNWVLEGKYNLSKRTFAYAVVYNAGATVAGADSVITTGLGVRHNF